MKPTFSIVIPTVNNVNLLIGCIESIKSFTPPPVDYEIIVVDNGSTDQTPQVLQSLKESYPEVFKIITNDTNKGFCTAINQGTRLSKGNYIVWLNDDTLVTFDWLYELKQILKNPHFAHPNIGMVGPMSNNVGGFQLEPELKNVTPADLRGVPEFLAEKKRNDQVLAGGLAVEAPLTGILSGFCVMLKREVIDKVGYIDERFSPGGYCDNDYVVRAIQAGFGIAIAKYVFVYHYCSKTIDKLYPDMKRGLYNWAKFVAKYREIKDNKLLLIQRVKIDTDQQLEVFHECALKNRDLIDGVIILSDRSELLDYDYCKAFFGDKLLQFLTNKKSDPIDEIRDRKTLYEIADKLKFDWVLSLDHDECFTPGTERERLDTLMNPLNPQVHAYKFLLNNFWRSCDLVRSDGTWGTMFVIRMWKNHVFPSVLRPRFCEDDRGLHCANGPISLPPDMAHVCDITLDHYGYLDFNETKRKKEYYEEVDNLPDPVKKILVGPSNYDHLTDESNLQMYRPAPWSISLNMMVKNCEVEVGRILMYYYSIIREFIVADTGSSDNTKSFLDEAKIPYFEMSLNDNFAEARNNLIEKSTMKYCMQVDPDEQPEARTLEKIAVMLNRDPDVCISHLSNLQKNGNTVMTKQPRIWRRSSEICFSGRVHETLEKSLKKIENVKIQDTNLTSTNTGFLMPDEQLQEKLQFYASLLEKEIEESPDNAKAYYELALHCRNTNDPKRALELLKQAVKIHPGYLAAIREIIMIKLYQCYQILLLTEGLATDEQTTKHMTELHNDLKKYALTHQKVGTERHNFSIKTLEDIGSEG